MPGGPVVTSADVWKGLEYSSLEFTEPEVPSGWMGDQDAAASRFLSSAMLGRGATVFGVTGTYWSTPNYDKYHRLRGVAVVRGQASGASSTTLTDENASWTTNEWAGYRLNVYRPNLDEYESYVILSNTATRLTFTASSDYTPAVEDCYVILSSASSGVVDSADSDSITDADAGFATGTGIGLIGVWCYVIRPTTGAINKKLIWINTATSFRIVWAWTDEGGFLPVAGDHYVIGGNYFSWKSKSLSGSINEEFVYVRKVRVDVTAEGFDGDGVYLFVKLWYSGNGQFADSSVLVPVNSTAASGSGADSDAWIDVPYYQGRCVEIELYGVARDQLVRIRGIEAEVGASSGRVWVESFRYFDGLNTDVDGRDLVGEASKLLGLTLGPGGMDLQSPFGLVRLNEEYLLQDDSETVALFVSEHPEAMDGYLFTLATRDEDAVTAPRMALQMSQPDVTPADVSPTAENFWGNSYGPVSLPWMIKGADLVIWGHAGMRPQVYWAGNNFPAGLAAINTQPVLTAASVGTGNIAAGTYVYTITRFDKELAREGGYIWTETITLSSASNVTISATSFLGDYDDDDSGERFTHYRVWRRESTTERDWSFVAEVDAATAEASGYTDNVTTADTTTSLIPYRFPFPSCSWATHWKGRFVAMGLLPWTIDGTTLRVWKDSKEIWAVAGSTGPWFGREMEGRNLLIKSADGKWIPRLIVTVYDVGVGDNISEQENPTQRIVIGEAWDEDESGDYTQYDEFSETMYYRDVEWQVSGAPNTIFFGFRRLGDFDMFLRDGSTEIQINESDGQYLVRGEEMGDRLIVYKSASICELVGGDWADPINSEVVVNDLDYRVIKKNIGLIGPYALCVDCDGSHWFFDGNEIYKFDGVSVRNVSGNRVKREMWRLNKRRLHNATMIYDPEMDHVILSGLYILGYSTTPRIAFIVDRSTERIAMFDDWIVTGCGVAAVR